MRRVRWLATIVAIGPLIGDGRAESGQIGKIVPNVEFKDIRYLRRTLSDLGEHKGFALVFLNAECPVSRRFAPKLRALDARYADKSWTGHALQPPIVLRKGQPLRPPGSQVCCASRAPILWIAEAKSAKPRHYSEIRTISLQTG